MDISGKWTCVVTEDETGCGGSLGKRRLQVSVTQRGNSIRMSAEGHTLQGALEGRLLGVSGRYTDADGETVEEHLTATVNAGGDKLFGSSRWTWAADTAKGCSGITVFSGVKS